MKISVEPGCWVIEGTEDELRWLSGATAEVADGGEARGTILGERGVGRWEIRRLDGATA